MKKVPASKQALRDEINRLRFVGNQLSNMAYNYGRSDKALDDHGRKALRELQVEWDRIERVEPRGMKI